MEMLEEKEGKYEIREAVNVFDVVDFAFTTPMPVTEVFNITRGILNHVRHEDLVLLYVLTRLHPKLPHHIKDTFIPHNEEDSIDNDIQDLLLKIMHEADRYLAEVKSESKSNTKDQLLPDLTHLSEKLYDDDDWIHEDKVELDDSDDEDYKPEMQDKEVKLEILSDPMLQDQDEKENMELSYSKKGVKRKKKKFKKLKGEEGEDDEGGNVERQCDQCEFKTVYKAGLRRHKRTVHGGMFKCPECDHIATSAYMLSSHINLIHKGVTYQCDMCEYTSTVRGNFMKHKKHKHSGRPFLCDQCDYAATSKMYLKEHIEAKHEGVRHNCDQCDFSASTARHLNTHKGVKHEGKVSLCDQCDYTTGNGKKWLKIHMKNKHDPVSCIHCDFSGTGKVELTAHMRLRHREIMELSGKFGPGRKSGYMKKDPEEREINPFQCDRCEFSSKFKRLLRLHLSTQHNIGTHPCTQCDFVAINAQELTKHVDKHGSFPCNQCEHVSSLASDLRKHKKMAHEERKYACDHCEFFSARADVLRIHKKAMHEGVKYPCNMCPYAARRTGDLIKHKQTVHRTH